MSRAPIRRDDRFSTHKPSSQDVLPAKPDSPGTAKDDIPKWMKGLVGIHVVTTYIIIIMHGLDSIPFRLGELSLAALAVAGIGSSLGLVGKQITKAVDLSRLTKS